MLALNNKRVLYVAPKFFGYEKDIGDELRRRGAQVDYVLDRPFNSPLMTAVTKFKRNWIIDAADRYYCKALEDFSRDNYDLIFVVNGQTLSIETLRRWRRQFSNATFLLYMWDSFGNRASAVENLKCFDHCFTFDKNDAAAYGLGFRPLFFTPGFERAPNPTPAYDVSFVGTAHTDRYAVVSRLSRTLALDTRTFWYLYLQAPWVLWAYRLINPDFRGARKAEFRFDPLSKDKVQGIFDASRAVLDIEHPQQTGLTMRTLETLGARKKLITTNQSVRDYDFYDEKNICIIDRQHPSIPAGFLTEPYRDVAPEIYQRYRIEGWMDEMLFGCK